jgi:SnoaL-like domain
VSRENADVARQLREALLRGGPEAAVDFFNPAVTFDVAVGHFEGLDGMSSWFREITKYLIDYEVVDAEFIPAGDCVVVNNVMRARGAHTDLGIQDQIYLLRFDQGKVVAVSRHATKEEALAMADGG